MTLTINGKTESYPNQLQNLSDLFNHLNLKEDGRIVEKNGTLFKQNEFNTTTIQTNDTIEIIQFMGGGQ